MDFAQYEPFFVAAGIRFIVASGAPTGVSAPKGSLYINKTGSTTSTRMYINTDGGTTWAGFTTSA